MTEVSYGKDAFQKLYDYLAVPHYSDEYCMAGFVLKNTLSDHGSVTREICPVMNGMLVNMVETPGIIKNKRGISAGEETIDPNAVVSMNMWGLMPEFVDRMESGFEKFFQTIVKKNPLKTEYLLPDVIATLLKDRLCSVKVLPTENKWFGMTYKDVKISVTEHIRELINEGVYRLDLYSDLIR